VKADSNTHSRDR